MKFLSILPILVFLLGLGCRADDTPNFVVIVSDDLGYSDIEPFGSITNKTPNLTKMAEQGRKLTSFYVAASVSTASRAALMTGCYPQRVGLQKGSSNVSLYPGDAHGLHPDEITIAETLKTAGYSTGCFGNWHLGDQPEFLPTAQGFDTFYGIPYSNDMWPKNLDYPFPDLPLLRDTKVIETVYNSDDQDALNSKFTDAAVTFIKNRKQNPFFVYLAQSHTQSHVEAIDSGVGKILSVLRAEGLDKTTFVLFTSVNGPSEPSSSSPLRGQMGSAFEGGQRVPAVVWWPGTVPAGTVSDELTTTMDLHPTFADLAGATLPTDRVIDGKYIKPILLGEEGAGTHYDRFFYQENGEVTAVRSGNWKMFTDGKLFNLKHDLGEQEDISDYNPDISMVLGGMIREFKQDLADYARPVGSAEDPRTLLPRPGVEGEQGFIPTLQIKK